MKIVDVYEVLCILRDTAVELLKVRYLPVSLMKVAALR